MCGLLLFCTIQSILNPACTISFWVYMYLLLFAVPTAPVTPPPTLSPPQAPTATTITVILPPPQQIETGEI